MYVKSERETAKDAKEEDAKIAEKSPAPFALQTLRPLRLIFSYSQKQPALFYRMILIRLNFNEPLFQEAV